MSVMKLDACFSALLLLPLLSVAVQDDGKSLVRIKVGPHLKFYDSSGFVVHAVPDYEHHRSARTPNACKFPTNVSDSQLDCVKYPRWVTCTQTCMFGYTLPEGIQREMKCNYDENVWRPTTEFQRCKPFVDCGMRLGPGGNYKCYTNYMHKGPTCEVSCSHYEDKPPVPAAVHECDIEGKWSPKLPFCAKAGSGMKLVSPPKRRKIVIPK